MVVVDVAVDAGDDADDFVHPIFQRAPGEDGGTDTARLYRYQAEVAAQACLAMLTRDEIEYVVCEWHEDFVIAFKNGSVELVSVKHRQYHRTLWNVGDLCKDGGLAHLFNSWRACGSADNVRLRLTTNGALNTNKGNAAALAKMCGPEPEVTTGVDAMATTVAQYFLKIRWKQPYPHIPVVTETKKMTDIVIPDGFVATIKRFLAVLRIDYKSVPSSRFITDHNLQQLLRPAILALELDHVDDEATYRRIVERIEQANRGEGERGQLAEYIATPSRVLHNVQMQQRIARRTLYPHTVREEFVYRELTVPTFTPGRLPMVAPGGANLRKKLVRGHVPDDEVAHAESLRSAWYVAWAEHRSGLPGDSSDLANMRLEVLDTAFDCRADAQSEAAEGSPYGARMNRLLRQRLTPEAMLATLPFKINAKHLRGLAYQLCDDCDYYFSDVFDVSEEEAS
ncbi:dsDNA nuclease domain-containing protein [Streptomyces antibioticus]|uniref:dsDNA nuclease domain-containing protein n=1 Tax=Streptomyces TaxID=1883 RepID=UPI00167600E2|nr:dsDNA nuclease domain-containing protein [Streptomyces tanashiensis]